VQAEQKRLQKRQELNQMRNDITTLQQALKAWEDKELTRAKVTPSHHSCNTLVTPLKLTFSPLHLSHASTHSCKADIGNKRVRAWANVDGKSRWKQKQSELAKVYLRVLRALSMGGVVTWSMNDLAILCKLLGLVVLKRESPGSLVFKRRDGDYDHLRKELPLGPGSLRYAMLRYAV
jgi:hypothetical protein